MTGTDTVAIHKQGRETNGSSSTTTTSLTAMRTSVTSGESSSIVSNGGGDGTSDSRNKPKGEAPETTTFTGSNGQVDDGAQEKDGGGGGGGAMPPSSSTSTTTTTTSPPSVDLEALIPPVISSSLSTSGLEYRLRQLREASAQHSQILTQKLASSQSGQHLLHMGSSLSTLPPDLHNLMTQLQPFVSTVEQAETQALQKLQALVTAASKVQHQARRIQQAQAAANLYADLQAAERAVEQYRTHRTKHKLGGGSSSQRLVEDGGTSTTMELDLIAPLERAAHLTSCLLAELHVANEQVRHATTTTSSTHSPSRGGSNSTPTKTLQSSSSNILQGEDQHDTELAQWMLRLAPRIRRFESNTVTALLQAMEDLLLQLDHVQQQQTQTSNGSTTNTKTTDTVSAPPTSGNAWNGSSAPTSANSLALTSNDGGAASTNDDTTLDEQQQQQYVDLWIMFGHCMRGLAILGRGADVESIFARVAIMPLIRSKVSMGRLDQGGSRGECAGLSSLLEEMATAVQQTYGPLLCLGEAMFHLEPTVSSHEGQQGESPDSTTSVSAPPQLRLDVDLITAGVWVPIVTALMADSAIKMAIFSPGIASVLQANYVALDTFLSELARRLLRPNHETADESSETKRERLVGGGGGDEFGCLENSLLTINQERIARAQERIYAHPKTAEFSKRWNLPIYYQLRFGDSCTRVNKALDQTRREGWIAQVFTGSEERAQELKSQSGFELSLFLELYDTLCDLWSSNVILRPLAKRFLRGSTQLVGRTISFINDSLDGKISFGEEEKPKETTNRNGGASEDGILLTEEEANPPVRAPYCWGDSEDDVAAVAWELAILDSSIRTDYVDQVCHALQEKAALTDRGKPESTAEESTELRGLISDVLAEASAQIQPVIDKSWNQIIVKLLTAKCSGPLSAVKGVAVMYRMTNRPPPTQPSSFVPTIFRPLNDFSKSFRNRTPEMIGAKWKQQIVVSVADRYAAAVDELLTTVQRTEVALKNRKARRIAAGGMSDGEKLKLQVYLDFKCFHLSVRDVGVEPATVLGLSKLKELTAEGESLQSRQQNPAT